MNKLLLTLLLGTMSQTGFAQTPSWPATTAETKAGSRWWWMGSAVDDANLKLNMDEYAKTGIGTLEITPIYGVQNNESREKAYLSSAWLDALKTTESIAAQDSMDIHMNNGTGWPFGGPWVSTADAAGKLATMTALISGDGTTSQVLDISLTGGASGTLNKVMAYPQADNSGAVTEVTDKVQGNTLTWTAPAGSWRIIAIYDSHTGQQVKRAAPGGEGNVLDHFNADAVKRYLDRFDAVFASSGASLPKVLFNDSYEVYYADWTPGIFAEFEKYRGYKLEDHMDQLLGYATDTNNQVLADYRATLGDMLLHNFTQQWTAWAHAHGSLTRNQAHGSPANLLDLYAAVDIPEIEGFGLTDFGIRGLRTDPGFTRANYSDFTTLKWASSAAHVTGKRLTSSETFTWLTEHFRTSLSQMKPDLDLMFCAGVNRMFFHGTTYSPQDVVWPGWKFYAAVDMSPTNSIWHDAPELMKYIERCQSFLQMGQPDNDLLVYAPFVNAMHKNARNGSVFADKLLTFPIDNITTKLPTFTTAVDNIVAAGYDCDYVSDLQLKNTTFEDGFLVTEGGARYRGLVVPVSTNMPTDVKSRLDSLAAIGAPIVYQYDVATLASISGLAPERMRVDNNLRVIRRKNDNGYHYFIANLTPKAVNQYVPLAVGFQSVVAFNPMNGVIYNPLVTDGKVFLDLKSGESLILQTYNTEVRADSTYRPNYTLPGKQINGSWTLSLDSVYHLDTLSTWENLSEAAGKYMGTGTYETTFTVDKAVVDQATGGFDIDLGDVRESARLYVNGEYEGTAWAAPFVLRSHRVHSGENTIRIEVTNLPANRIRQMDIDGQTWRIFKDVNLLDIKNGSIGVSGVTSFADWSKLPSGLNSAVTLIPVHDILGVEQREDLSGMACEDSVFYPVYRLSMTDGSAMTDDSLRIDRSVAYTRTSTYDFTSTQPPLGGLNVLALRVMNGFEGKYNGAQAKTIGAQVQLYDGLTFTSPSTNMYYFFPGYGMDILRDCDATLDVKAGDIVVMSYMQGAPDGNTAAYQSGDSLNVCVQSLDDKTVTLMLDNRSTGRVYRQISVYRPTQTPSAVRAVSVAAKEEWYNLQGMKIARPTRRGIYILNGRKVVR
ncbi:MAG: glycosyl hydrolase family 2 [Prevotella sp.]|nr:glycosyl hydrolase family 2 [Prevotella sp.]